MRMNGRGEVLAGLGKAWLDDDTYIFQTGSDALGWKTVNQRGDVIDPQGFNTVCAGGGKWATWLAGRGPKGNFGYLDPAGIVVDIGRDGTVAWCPNQQAGHPIIVNEAHYDILARCVRVVGPGHIVASLFDGRIWSNKLGYAVLPAGVTPFKVTLGWGWLLYHTHEHLIIQRFSEPYGKRLAPKPAYSPDMVQLAIGMKVAWCLNEAETQTATALITDTTVMGDISDLRDVPLPELEPIVAIDRPCLVGFFAGGPAAPLNWQTDILPQSLPGNCYLEVATGLIRKKDGTPLAQYIQGTLVTAIEARAVAAALARLIPVLYWDARNWPRWPSGAPQGSVLCIQAYCRKDEDLRDFDAELRGIVALAPGRFKIAIICQCYTSNIDLTINLKALVPIFARIVKDNPNVIAALAFNGSGRETGLQDHPEVRALWEQLAAGVTGLPVLSLPTAPPAKPPIPTPPKPPKSTLFPSATRFTGAKMNVYARLNGKFVGVDPSSPNRIYADRTAGGAWEEIKLTAHENGRFDALLVAVNKQLSFGPGGLELRPAGAIGEWELPFATTQPEGTNLLYRVQDGSFAGPVLTIEAA